MENCISYSARGKSIKFSTKLEFGDLTDEQVAVKVYLAVSFDRDDKLENGEIPCSLSDEEQRHMTDAEKKDWECITKIEFVDYTCNKKLSMQRMSDIQGKYKVDSF